MGCCGEIETVDVVIDLSTTLACANIVDSNFARPRFIKSLDMGINKICDIYVVSDASSICSGVISSTNLNEKSCLIVINVKIMNTATYEEIDSTKISMWSTFSPGMIPKAASKQAPEIRPCSRSSGLGASPSRPSGSDPITLKYLI